MRTKINCSFKYGTENLTDLGIDVDILQPHSSLYSKDAELMTQVLKLASFRVKIVTRTQVYKRPWFSANLERKRQVGLFQPASCKSFQQLLMPSLLLLFLFPFPLI